MSVQHRCRLCLKLARNKIPIFKDDFPKMIEILTGLRVDPNDDFPKTSCIDCANNVKVALRTKKQIIQSHKTLLEEFLAKCKEFNDYSSIKNTIDESLIKKVSPKSDFKKCNAENSDIVELGDQTISLKDDVVSTASVRPVRTKTKSRFTLNSHQSNVETRQKNRQDLNSKSDVLNQDNAEQLVTEATKSKKGAVNINIISEEFDTKKEYDCGDSSGEPASPMSDPASDVDWTPDKKEGNTDTPIIRPQKKKIKPILKGSDGVFFVKKRNTLISRKKKTAETVIRIKKKPKGRTPPTRVTCEICKKEVQSYWLQKHMETHQYNPATCEFCGLISKSATALRHHVFYYHRSSANEYICDQCGRSFRSKYRLNLHKKKEHGGTKDFECTTCGKKFFERMHLKRHVDKTHKNIRPYVCDFCGKTFKSRNHIKIHERIHSKEAPYTCHMCGESFKMKLTLRTHLKGVHNVQEVQKVFCDICNRGFASDLALKAHVNSRIHETEKCQYCSEMFTRDYMINHLREVHAVGATAINNA